MTVESKHESGQYVDRTWSDLHDVPRVVLYPRHLRRTALIALVVGSVLFAINHLDEVLRGSATRVTWIKIAVTYLVPFTVSNLGLLVGSRVRKR
jgi:membrane protease YdiL (CAAX protease family)